MALGRTNIYTYVESGSSGSSGGGVTTVDLPTHPKSISAASNNQKVIISLTYSDTDYISGVEARYKTGGYPTSPTDGRGVTAEGAATSITIDGLTNSTKYYFRVYLCREINGVKYYQTDDTNATVTCIPSAIGIDGVTPAIVAENYMLIDTSGSFTMTIPEGISSVTAYLVSGGGIGAIGGSTADGSAAAELHYGGNGGYGGKTVTQQLEVTGIINCNSVIGSASTNFDTGTTTNFIVDGTTYSATGYGLSGGSRYGGQGSDGLLTQYGYIGSSGGAGGRGTGKESSAGGASGGIGAGKGGKGGYLNQKNGYSGGSATNYGCGGGGGGGAYLGGYSGSGGSGTQGCIIIAWS